MAWAVLQPVITMVVFTAVFGGFLHVKSAIPGVPYQMFSFVGLLPWTLFSGSLQRAGTSLVGNSSLLTKVYFPRLVIPISAVVAGLVDFVIALIVGAGLMAYYGIAPSWPALWLPAFVLLALVTSLRSACGCRRSMCSIGTCNTSSRSWCSCGCTCRLSPIRRRVCTA